MFNHTMTTYYELHKRVFEELYDSLQDSDIKTFEKELLYVYQNEPRYRCQALQKKLRVLTHRMNEKGELVLLSASKIDTNLPYMNYYEEIDSIFATLYERYGYSKCIMTNKAELLQHYDAENSHMYPKAKDVDWTIIDGVVVLG